MKKLRCSIRNINLPPAPKPTKPYRTNSYTDNNGRVVLYRPSPIATVSDMGRAVTEKTKANSWKEWNKNAQKKWDQMVEMARDNIPDEEIAKETGYTVQYVRKRLQLLRRSGTDIPIGRVRVKERIKSKREEAERLKKEGKTYREIHEITGLSLSTLSKYLGSPKK